MFQLTAGKLIGGGLSLLFGANILGKLTGSDPDFTQAYLMNRMSGRGGFFKTYFVDGLKSMFLGSRTMSAMHSGMGMGFAGAMYGHGGMMGMNPYLGNPMMMGAMPFHPMAMGGRMWGI